jgi:diguanylate cyclase (GGDEF)-like protein
MQGPTPRRNLAHAARRNWPGILAPPYLLVLLFLQGRTGRTVFLALASLGFLAAAYYLGSYLVARREGKLLPRGGLLMVWGGVAALELHAFVPQVARSRAVPAALFFGVGYTLPAVLSVPFVLGGGAWLVAAAHPAAWLSEEGVSMAAMALLAGGAGIFARKVGGRRHPVEDGMQDAIRRSRALVLPWEESDAGGSRSAGNATQDSTLLLREQELKEGVLRALESLLPLIGAAQVGYLAPPRTPGAAVYEGFLVSRGEEKPREFSVPDTYVPVRETALFLRPFFEDGLEAGRYAPWRKGSGAVPTGIAAVPVCRDGIVEGAIVAVREEEGPWRDPVLPLLELAAYFAGREIERVRTLHREERYLLREDWYHQMVRKMAQAGMEGDTGAAGEMAPRHRARVYAEAVAQVRRRVGADRVLLVGSSDGGTKGWITWEETASGTGGSTRAEPLGDSYVGWVIRTGTQRIFSGAHGSSRTQDVLPAAWQRPGESSHLVLPVAGSGGFRGAVVCVSGEGRRFLRQHAETVRDITEVMQMGLSHAEHLETLSRRASTDPLTGLLNRRVFLARFSEELARLDGRHPCAVVMLDVDHFKRVNDTYGHPFGDEVLRQVAGVLDKAVRKGDAAARYGGEEFVLYLHMADPLYAGEAAERFRRMIRQIRFLPEGRRLTVTVSVGVACAPSHGNGADDLIRCADEALYLSKQGGRDRVTVWPGTR